MARGDVHADGDEVEGRHQDEEPEVALEDAVVDALLGQQRSGLLGEGLEHDEHTGEGQAAAVVGEEAPQRERLVLGLAADLGERDLGERVLGLVGQEAIDLLRQLGRDAGEGEPGGRGLRRAVAGTGCERSEGHQRHRPSLGVSPPPPIPPAGPPAPGRPATDAAIRSR